MNHMTTIADHKKLNPTKPDLAVEDKIETAKEWSIVLYNDDVNSFEHVIDCLCKYCKHEPMQAEQCAMIVHHNGKIAVKQGDYDDLRPICEALCENGLSAQIELIK